jgi:predicted dehydrogenase
MLRVGMIGAGMVSQHHMLAWQKLAPEAAIVAIADPVPDNLARRAETFGVKATYANAAAMLETETLDAIDIAAPREFHAALVHLGLAHGVAVLCQKPLAPTLAEAEELVSTTTGKRLMVHENWRFRQYYRDAARWLANGTIGTVHQCTMTLLTSGLLPDADGVRAALVRQPFFKTERRLIVNEVLIHHLDTLRVLLGPLQVVAARVGQICQEIAGEDNALISLAASSGAAAILLGNLAAAGAPASQADDLLVIGDAGTIRLRGNRLERFSAAPEAIEYDMAACYQGSYDATIAHFADCLRSGAAFETTPEDNLHTLRLVEDTYRLAGWPPAAG